MTATTCRPVLRFLYSSLGHELWDHVAILCDLSLYFRL